jgi:hypothetical protein
LRIKKLLICRAALNNNLSFVLVVLLRVNLTLATFLLKATISTLPMIDLKT